MSNKKWIITGTVVVAAVVAYLAFYGPSSNKTGTEGTIGAANRYQSEQMTSQDVTLDNPQVAAFIQSDTFRKLAANEHFREAAQKESFGKVVASDELREVSARYDLALVLNDANVKDLLRNEEFGRALTDASLREAMLKADWIHLIEANRMTELLRLEALRELALKTEFQRLAEAAVVADARTIADFNKVAEGFGSVRNTEAFRHLEASKYFIEAIQYGALDFFRTAEGAQFALEGLRRITESRSFIEALKMDGFIQFMDALNVDNFAAVREISDSPEMLSVLSDGAFREAASRAELGLVADAGLKEALAKVPE